MADKVGDEILVNSTTESFQQEPAAASLADGGFVVAWEDDSTTGGDTDDGAVRAQVFGPEGNPEGEEILVNTTTVGAQTEPAVVGLEGGDFVVAWEDTSAFLNGANASILDVRAQRFDSGGNKTGDEFLLNTTRSVSQESPDLAPLDDGGFVAAWKDASRASDGDLARISSQVFSPTGGKEGEEFVANSTTTSQQFQPEVAGLADGGFTAVWVDQSMTGGDTSGTAIRTQAFAPDASNEGGESLVNTVATLGRQENPAVTGLTDGRYVAAWDDPGNFPSDDQGVVGARFFQGDGTPDGDGFRLNETTLLSQSDPVLASLPGGGFVGAWEDTGMNDVPGEEQTEITTQVFNPDGTRASAETIANDTLAGQQMKPEIATLEDGGYVLVWKDGSETGGDTDETAIRAQVFDRPEGVPAPSDDDGTGGGDDATGNPSPTVSPNIVVLNGEAQTLALPFAADVRGTAAGETVQVPAGATVSFDGNTGDRVELADPLSAFEVSASGNQLALTAGDTEANISMNDDVDIAFADGSATASIGVGASGVEITLDGTTVGSTFDESVVQLDPGGASALSGNTGDGNPPASDTQNIVVLSGEAQTVRVPFTADVRGTAAGETVQVPDGANMAFSGNTDDEVEFADPFSEFSVSSSGNQIVLENGETRATVSLNDDVAFSFADGSTDASIGQTSQGFAVILGGEVVGSDFDPGNVTLDGSSPSELGLQSADPNALSAPDAVEDSTVASLTQPTEEDVFAFG